MPNPNPKPPDPGKGKRGRRLGVPNKVTQDVRTAIAKIAETNVSKVNGWLARVAKEDPARALDCYLRLLEYHIPKLTRAEIVRPNESQGRVIDSSQLTAEQREQLRQMILATQSQAPLLEQQASTRASFVATGDLEPAGLGDAQVIDSEEE